MNKRGLYPIAKASETLPVHITRMTDGMFICLMREFASYRQAEQHANETAKAYGLTARIILGTYRADLD